MLRLDGKVTALGRTRDSNWPPRLAEMYAALAHKHPQLNAVIVADPLFGQPDHVVFAQAPGFDKARAAERFLARAERDPQFAWNGALIALLEALPAEKALPVLRRLWGQAGQDEAILPLLARKPQAEDRERLREGLKSGQLNTVKAAVTGLAIAAAAGSRRMPGPGPGVAAVAFGQGRRAGARVPGPSAASFDQGDFCRRRRLEQLVDPHLAGPGGPIKRQRRG